MHKSDMASQTDVVGDIVSVETIKELRDKREIGIMVLQKLPPPVATCETQTETQTEVVETQTEVCKNDVGVQAEEVPILDLQLDIDTSDWGDVVLDDSSVLEELIDLEQECAQYVEKRSEKKDIVQLARELELQDNTWMDAIPEPPKYGSPEVPIDLDLFPEPTGSVAYNPNHVEYFCPSCDEEEA